MNLLPFSPEYLRVNGSLPFDVVDPSGHLLMRKGSVIRDEAQLAALKAHVLMVEAEQSEEWRRNLAGAIDSLVRQNATLKTIAAARPNAAAPLARAAAPVPTLTSELSDMQMHTSILLREESHLENGWCGRIEALSNRVQQLSQRDADGALYLLIQATTLDCEHYSSHHALLCALVVELVCAQLQWPPKAVASLRLAALTMNFSMTTLQNQLAVRQGQLTEEHRLQIASHPQRSVEMLKAAAVTDPLWLEVVAEHHHDAQPGASLEALSPVQRLTRVLRRVDVFTARISPRSSRAGLPAPLAASGACLGADGRPDEVGSATIKALGIYPPGSYVRLVTGEIAVVMRRGARANHPRVATFVGREGQPLGIPALRDTADRRYAIKGAERVGDVRVRLHHERMLALR